MSYDNKNPMDREVLSLISIYGAIEDVYKALGDVLYAGYKVYLDEDTDDDTIVFAHCEQHLLPDESQCEKYGNAMEWCADKTCDWLEELTKRTKVSLYTVAVWKDKAKAYLVEYGQSADAPDVAAYTKGVMKKPAA